MEGTVVKFACLLLTISAAMIFATNAAAGAHGGGIKAGLMMSDPSGSDRDTYKIASLNTLSFGAFYRYTFSGRVSMQTDFLYAHKGARATYGRLEGKINIWYFEIAPALQYRVLDTRKVFGALYAGPLYGFRLEAKVESDVIGSTHSYGVNSSVKMNDFGYFVGAKLGLPRGSDEMAIDVRYSAGLVSPNDTPMDIDLKNRAVSVMLELYFGKD
jgi:hypothetical protein